MRACLGGLEVTAKAHGPFVDGYYCFQGDRFLMESDQWERKKFLIS